MDIKKLSDLMAGREGLTRDEVPRKHPIHDPVDLTGARNLYQCDACGGVIVTVHKHHGVTPMFLACRATPDCRGSMASCMYLPFPELLQPTHEWYTPDADELKTFSAGMRQHVEQGGVVLRKIEPFESSRDQMLRRLLKK